jgi:PAS domain S-box-containing protein
MLGKPGVSKMVEPASAGKPRDEEPYRLLVESISDYAIYMLDPTGIITSWNAGAQRFKGYTADEVIGTNFSLLYR